MEQNGKNARQAFVIGNAAIDDVFLLRDLPLPGESVLGTAGHTGLGGKGANQALALGRTGVPTTFVAAVGTDWYGQRFRQAMAPEQLTVRLFERPDFATDRSIIFTGAAGDNVIVTTNDCAASLTVPECLSALKGARPGDVVLLQGNLRAEVTAALCRDCRRRGLYLVLNPSPFDIAFRDLVPLSNAIFVNETEAQRLTGQAREQAVEALLGLGAGQVVLTLGSEGALLGSAGDVLHVPAVAVAVVDVTGAGDCYEGVAVGSALLRDTPIDETALRHASQAAAHTIQGAGAAGSFPSPGQIAALLSDLAASG